MTFGTGYRAIFDSLIEPDFGLRVAANCISHDEITLAEARGLGKGKRNAVSRLPLPGEIFSLGLRVDEEWIKKIGGKATRRAGLARAVSGADSLQIETENFALADISPKLAEMLSLYESDDYKKVFPFLEYFRRETDRELIAQLDSNVVEAMRRRDPEVGFSSPDDFDLNPDQYQISRRGRK